jgi:hypothetical protein
MLKTVDNLWKTVEKHYKLWRTHLNMGSSSLSPPPHLGVKHASTAIHFLRLLDKNFPIFYPDLSVDQCGERGMAVRLYTGQPPVGYPTDKHIFNHICFSPLIHLLYDYYYYI